MSAMADLVQLIERDIPVGRKHLRESHTNLENVASYCEDNYLQAHDKRHALEETKNYTTQSLASVAYQINTLATNFLHLLDLQMNQLTDMESNVNHISQTVNIHKEKVARREIGVLTTNKTTTRPPGVKTPGIIFPEQPERPVKYVRKSIDYTQLDDIGHGVKQAQPQKPVQRRSSSSSNRPAAPVTTVTGGQAPTTKPPTPPTTGIYSRPGGASTTGTLTRQTSSPYRTPAPPVSPPALPSHYAPNYPKTMGPPPPQPASEPGSRTSGYASRKSIGMPPQGPPPAPPTGMVHPMSHGSTGYSTSQVAMVAHPQNPPPTPPLPPMPGETYPSNINEPPPPPPMDSSFGGPPGTTTRMGNISPPLPPPPGIDSYEEPFNPLPPPSFEPEDESFRGNFPRGSSLGGPRVSVMAPGTMGVRGSMVPSSMPRESTEWVPKEYIEKVVAIYDYQKDKDDELSFSEGSLIYVVKKNDDGWWEGVMDAFTGLFPGNYVEPCM